MISRLRFRRLLDGPALPGDVHAEAILPCGVWVEPDTPEGSEPPAAAPDPGGCTCTDTCECTPGSKGDR